MWCVLRGSPLVRDRMEERRATMEGPPKAAFLNPQSSSFSISDNFATIIQHHRRIKQGFCQPSPFILNKVGASIYK